jgi:hypothetical protein
MNDLQVANPALWAEYSLGAQLSYRKHGVECALDVEALHSGADTIMFLAVINRAGRMVAGVRAKGPLRSADPSVRGRVAAWAITLRCRKRRWRWQGFFAMWRFGRYAKAFPPPRR